jgi:hypothetical protein
MPDALVKSMKIRISSADFQIADFFDYVCYHNVMPDYKGIQKEHQLKNLVFDDFFAEKAFSWEQEVDNIDFLLTDKKARGDLFSEGPGSSRHYLWAEAKKGAHDVFALFTQLVLTCKKTYEKGDHLAPPWLGVFDESRIAFVPFHDMLPIFNETDFNWNQTPSNHETADFQKAQRAVEKTIGAKIVVFHFGTDDRDIKEFIKTHFIAGANASIKSPITKDNFVQIFYKWVKNVLPTINMTKEEWTEYKNSGILECDFFRADIMSSGGNTIVNISDKLKIILKNDNYKLQDKNKFNRLMYVDIDFADGGDAYNRFWNRYERPPAEVYQQYIIDRRDLLVPQNIRERKGTFFTPRIWADTSKAYLAAVFGDAWQDEYYIWDCAAGTGNLLAGLTNKYHVWASDIDQTNIDSMLALTGIDERLDLLPAHIFQFDFLNDILTKEEETIENEGRAKLNLLPVERKIPPSLCTIIDEPEKRKKLIIYINPPYAEATSYGVHGKSQVANKTSVFKRFSATVGAEAMSELYAQFFVRICHNIPDAKLATFSTVKFITSHKFLKFRKFFLTKNKSAFICKANTFDNVSGSFPVAFSVWDFEQKERVLKLKCDILLNNAELTKAIKKGEKIFYSTNGFKPIGVWRKSFYDIKGQSLGSMIIVGPSMQSNTNTFITSNPAPGYIKKHMVANITEKNLIEMSIYFAVRLCIEPTWINNREQYFFPNDGWKTDTEFQHDCLIFTLFHGQNRFSCTDGTNHWIPFTEKEVDAKENFDSNFMSKYLKDKTFSPEAGASLESGTSKEARAVLDAGRELWKHYHAKIKTNKTASVNASFYDIRAFFQGRKESGTMNTKSEDETYNALLKTLREKQKTLAKKIEPKVYEYGFLKE